MEYAYKELVFEDRIRKGRSAIKNEMMTEMALAINRSLDKRIIKTRPSFGKSAHLNAASDRAKICSIFNSEWRVSPSMLCHIVSRELVDPIKKHLECNAWLSMDGCQTRGGGEATFGKWMLTICVI